MDLSKVTFPTFVLEPRSMLERITDFMSHPDLIFGHVNTHLVRSHHVDQSLIPALSTATIPRSDFCACCLTIWQAGI